MPNPRQYTDDQLRQAVAGASSWADVLEALGRRRGANPTGVQAVAKRLGLDTSNFDRRRSHRAIKGPPLPFSRSPRTGRASGLSIAARWYLDRGYNVSTPLEPAPYDLIAESDDGLKRVQVKTTAKVTKSGRYGVRIARKAYDPAVPRNALGSYRMVPYSADEVDLFFILTGAGTVYMVPIDAVTGSVSLILDEKYKAFVVAS